MPTVVWIIIVAVLMLFAGLVGWVLARFTESLEPSYELMELQAFPEKPENVSPKFLTAILRQGGHISRGTKVKHFEFKKLKGGVHFHVIRASLTYTGVSDVDAATRPKSVVVKMINGGESVTLWKKLLLWSKMKWPDMPFVPNNIAELAYRLRGYKIETRFYRHYAHQVAIPVPKCFYNYENLYSVQFLMVLEDLSECETGEPNGFSMDDSKACLENLAVLHAEFWKAPFFSEPNDNVIKPSIWKHGGYWFGAKEMPHHKSVSQCYDYVQRVFQQYLDCHGSSTAEQVNHTDFGSELDSITQKLTTAVHRINPRTMVHGDYKISNLFVDKTKRRVITIDWQWMGGGCCATDVAYFIYTSVMLPEAATPRSAPPSPSKGAQKRKESLSNSSGSNSLTVPSTLSSNSANGNSLSSSASLERYPYYAPHEMELLKCYHAALMKRGVKDYPFEVFEQHYLMNVLYFLVFCLRAKYSNMTPADVQRYKTKGEDGLHLRSYPHINQLLTRGVVLLKHLKRKNLKKKKKGEEDEYDKDK